MTASLHEQPAAASPAPLSGLLAAEVQRLAARRFVRVLLLLGAVGFLLAVGVSFTQFEKPTAATGARAEAERQRVIADIRANRQQCLEDPARPQDQPAEELCGPPPEEQDISVDGFVAHPAFRLSRDLSAGATGVGTLGAVLLFVLGATWIGAEWSTRSIVALLFWEPRRLRVVTVKAAVLAVFALAVAALAQVLWLGCAVFLARTRGSTQVPAGFWGGQSAEQARIAVLGALVALLGFGLANLIRNTGAALGIGFVYFAVVENAVRGLRPRWQPWLFSDNAIALMKRGGHEVFLPGATVDDQGYLDNATAVQLSNVRGGLVLGTYLLVILAVGALLFRRRDLH